PHIGKANATVITFLISAIAHEIVMASITKKLRGYGFICQMLQLPIVMLQRTKWVRGRKTFNNVCFWCSMILGLSLVSLNALLLLLLLLWWWWWWLFATMSASPTPLS